MENKKWYNKSMSGKVLLEYILIIGGLVCGIYFLVFFDTSVAVPNGQVLGIDRVNNFGLMQDRQNGIYLGFGATAAGLVLRFLGKRHKEEE